MLQDPTAPCRRKAQGKSINWSEAMASKTSIKSAKLDSPGELGDSKAASKIVQCDTFAAESDREGVS